MTFGPLPSIEPARPVRHRRHGPTPGRRDVMALASLLLAYPDDDMCVALPGLRRAVAALPASTAATRLREFLAWFTITASADRRIEYVRAFDHKRRSALYVTFATYGDTRRRGAVLAELRQRYHEAGFVENSDELPDYLPTLLQFAALVGDEADDVLGQMRPGIEAITRALKAQHSPYAPVLQAVTEVVPAKTTVPDREGVAA